MRTFLSTAYVWKDVSVKASKFSEINRFIDSSFDVKNYTDSPKVKRILFAHLINLDAYASMFDYSDRFAWRKGDIFLYGKIPYEIFAAADDKKAVQLLCESYLAAILRIPLLKGMKKVHFQTQKLHDDLEIFFKENGFL
jgi:hypothetical protein